jgi:hypothetical protein
MAIDSHPLDTDAKQRLVDPLDDLSAGWVQASDGAAKQHFAGQAKGPALIGQFETLLF